MTEEIKNEWVKKLNFLKFSEEKYYKVDGKNYELKDPTENTIGADLMIITKGSLKKDECPWIIPTHKQFIMEHIPYFKALYDVKSNWRKNKKARYQKGVHQNCTSDAEISFSDAPSQVSKQVVFNYIKNLYGYVHSINFEFLFMFLNCLGEP